MIYGFIADDALLLKPTTAVVQWDALNQGCGYITEKIENYLVDRVTTIDQRSGRLTVLSDKAAGKITVNADHTKIGDDEPAYYEVLQHIVNFYNIVEYLEFTDGQTVEDMDNTLSTDSNYGSYVQGTLKMSTTRKSVVVQLANGGTETITVPEWIEFAMNTATKGDLYFHFWFGEDAFLLDYPYTTILDIIWPCDPNSFLDMNASYSNTVEAISKSARFSNRQTDPDVIESDHSGMYPFETRYHNGAYTLDYTFSFGLLYKGRRPTMMDAILYTRQALIDTGITDTATWRALFPDLFIEGAFYLIPMWDNNVELPNKTIYTSITTLHKLKDKVQQVFPTYNPGELYDRLEIVTTSAAEFLIASIADATNDETDMSLSTRFTKYVAVDGTTEAWLDQDEDSKDFNELLSKAIGVALGGDNVYNIETEVLEGRDWLTFISNYVKVHVLKRNSYPA